MVSTTFPKSVAIIPFDSICHSSCDDKNARIFAWDNYDSAQLPNPMAMGIVKRYY